jgi:hypothetical protein
MQKFCLLLIVLGSLLVLAALVFVPTVIGPAADPSALAVIAGLFSLGTLTAATGLYLRARSMAAQNGALAKPRPRKNQERCGICEAAPAMLWCTQHQAKVCAGCMANHDSSACMYVDVSRRAIGMGATGAWR